MNTHSQSPSASAFVVHVTGSECTVTVIVLCGTALPRKTGSVEIVGVPVIALSSTNRLSFGAVSLADAWERSTGDATGRGSLSIYKGSDTIGVSTSTGGTTSLSSSSSGSSGVTVLNP
ncbi:hypothetical protein D3C72_1236220 [compost metagenome]